MSAGETEAAEFRLCALVPTYDNPATVRSVVERIRGHVSHVIVVDDASGSAGRAACEQIASDQLAHVVHRAHNGGKGAAVKTGLAAAQELGYTHALQLDADGQHAFEDIPRFIAAASANPTALVLGAPLFDASAPSSRQAGRKVTAFWIRLETGEGVISDAMCGFRVYPVAAALAARAWGNAMDFDPEIAVKMVWGGAPVVNLPTRVRYLDEGEGGVSHFRLFADNALISWMHTRLMVRRVFGALLGWLIPPLKLELGASLPSVSENTNEASGGHTGP